MKNCTKTLLIILASLCIVSMLFISCNKGAKSDISEALIKDENGEVASENDFAYLSGYFTAKNIGEDYERMFGSDAKDAALLYLIQGIKDYKDGNVEEIDMYGERVRNTQEKFMQKVQEAEEREMTGNLEKANAFLEENKTKEGIFTTDSGLQYEILTQGSGEKVPSDVVSLKVNYRMCAGDADNVVDESSDIEFNINQLIPGVQEGLKLMNVGSKYRFYISPELGYGSQALGNIPANSLLVFDVEVLSIVNSSSNAETK